MTTEADYVIVGGGVAGCTLAARLQKKLPDASIVLVEAGGDPSVNPNVMTVPGIAHLRDSEQAWMLEVAANKHLDDRTAQVSVGKGLGGSAAINSGAWTRGPASNYDLWAEIVGDDAWSYESLLPFFRMTEHDQGKDRDEKHHGYEGPLKVSPVKGHWPRRKYPLRASMQTAWEQAGVSNLPEWNNGQPNGLTDLVEAWDAGKRQLPGKFYDLSRVHVMSSQQAYRVTFRDDSTLTATGVDLVSGQHITAHKEVIISTGTYHTPKILMLSGVGDSAVLQSHLIPTFLHNQDVGQNLVDHLAVGMTWKLKNPERGLSLGSPLMIDPSYAEGAALDFLQFGQVDDKNRLQSITTPEETDRKLLLGNGALHMENFLIYAPLAMRMMGVNAPFDGSIASSISVCLSTTSKGHVSIRSADPAAPPYIDVNFNATEADRFILREALRKTSKVLLETEAGQSFVEEELVPEGNYAAITSAATDEEIDARIRAFAFSLDHPMGSCAMGKVVDSHCRVMGVHGLRVVDASVFPIPIAAHIQAAVYATAERVAEWMGNGE